jgi:hypothetical protein
MLIITTVSRAHRGTETLVRTLLAPEELQRCIPINLDFWTALWTARAFLACEQGHQTGHEDLEAASELIQGTSQLAILFGGPPSSLEAS